MTVLDLKPAVDLAFQVVDGVIVTFLVPAIGVYLMRKLHMDANSQLAGRILTAVENGAALGLSRAQAAADAKAGGVDVKNAAIATGVAYVQGAFSPSTLSAAGVTPDHLEAMLESKIVQLIPALAPTPTSPIAGKATP